MKELEKPRFIIVTGPESTGKTQLAQQLALHLNCNWIPELSREYIENLNRSYTYNDVEIIAQKQIAQIKTISENNSKLTIIDTGLIITKVWFDVVYRKYPDWLTRAITEMPKALHLLCDTDLPWKPDKVRENGGEMRKKLTEIYKAEFETYDFPYKIISGTGNSRLANSLLAIEEYYTKNACED